MVLAKRQCGHKTEEDICESSVFQPALKAFLSDSFQEIFETVTQVGCLRLPFSIFTEYFALLGHKNFNKSTPLISVVADKNENLQSAENIK